MQRERGFERGDPAACDHDFSGPGDGLIGCRIDRLRFLTEHGATLPPQGHRGYAAPLRRADSEAEDASIPLPRAVSHAAAHAHPT